MHKILHKMIAPKLLWLAPLPLLPKIYWQLGVLPSCECLLYRCLQILIAEMLDQNKLSCIFFDPLVPRKLTLNYPGNVLVLKPFWFWRLVLASARHDVAMLFTHKQCD